LECKHRSPSAGILRLDYDPVAIARTYTDVADAISVLCDQPHFGGDLKHLTQVREAVGLPVLCKDFVIDSYQVYEARAYGADAILLMCSVLEPELLKECFKTAQELEMDALVEVRDQEELKLALDVGARLIGINNRNLESLEVDLEVTERLAPLVPKGVVTLCESGIQSHLDILRLRDKVDGFLVGSRLMSSENLADATRQLAFGRVKVCGLTSPEDARAAWKAGATMGGLIFAAESPRKVSLEKARQICTSTGLRWVGVFVNEDPKRVEAIAHELDLHAVQLHGEETPAYLRSLSLSCPVWKAVRVEDGIPPVDQAGADRLLLDTFRADRRGGTGESFDWDLVRSYPEPERLILAGGLNPDNAAAADSLGTWALDVNSGVEQEPGKKDPVLLQKFFANLRSGKEPG
jgi:indole-3-glycerol phosphate synthase/phosphoribosylanthranilate isomerase